MSSINSHDFHEWCIDNGFSLVKRMEPHIRNRIIFNLCFSEGISQRVIGELFDITTERVRQIYKKEKAVREEAVTKLKGKR